MAKTIKFNLICDGNPVRTLEDLQNNFSIEDVLEYYNTRLLHRWLNVRGYSEQLEKVSAITSTERLEIIKELIRIFDITANRKEIEEGVYILKHRDERIKLYDIYAKRDYKVHSIIYNYEVQYKQLVDEILNNPTNAAIIKANIAEITMSYRWILDLSYRELFWILKEKSMLAVMCLLMNEYSRYYYIPSEQEDCWYTEYGFNSMIETDNIEAIQNFIISDKNTMYKAICDMISTSDFKTNLGENLMSFAGVTDGYWKDLKPKGKKYMIISIGSGDYVRSAGDLGGDLDYSCVHNKFVFVDGIDYKSNSKYQKLVYMEV